MFLILLFKLLTQFPFVSFLSISISSLCSLSQSSLFSLSTIPSFSSDQFFVLLMRLSILCPTTPPTRLGGDRWGFVILASTKAPPLGAALADKSPLIPCIGGGAAVGKWGMEENGGV